MATSTTPAGPTPAGGTLFGHPAGLFTLFFAEMWERFSYYGMRALLIFYMMKGFLGYGDKQAYAVYGAYTALVYMTPYFGGMLADRILGQRRAVVMGGLLMAAGHLLMTVENKTAFFVALALLICGNGFFKPNISTIVGSLYPKMGGKKDAGFTIFYMGINLGAFMSPVICGYVGQTYGWHYGFGCATAGMLVGVAVFVAPSRVTQLLILGGALGTSIALPFLQDTFLQLVVRIFLALVLSAAGIAAFMALGRGGLPKEAGAPPDPARLTAKLGGVIRTDVAVYLGVLLAIPVFAFIVQQSKIAGATLTVTGVIALVYIGYELVKVTVLERHRLFVALILTFFSMLFWAFFEQAGSSLNNFTDRNVDLVIEDRRVTEQDVGTTIQLRVPIKSSDPEIQKLPLLSQEQLGHKNDDPSMKALIKKTIGEEEKRKQAGQGVSKPEEIEKLVAVVDKEDRLTLSGLDALRSAAGREKAERDQKVVSWKVAASNVGMSVGGAEIPASEFQAVNPCFILLIGPIFSAIWTFLASRKKEPSTPTKFSLGLLQLGLGFAVLWYGAGKADARGMVGLSWLIYGYLLHTTGELCLSPVGLSMITKLSPTRMVSTMMGMWFLATAFSQYLAGLIAALTSVSGDEDAAQFIPVPLDTVGIYGNVFGKIAIAGVISSLICFALVPLLKKWMHADAEEPPTSTGKGQPSAEAKAS